ncbi:MAG: integrin alpha, partial [Mangrovicoccus sp.]|nr:integrin alpha [Mangrovicoccus sp.]
MSKFSDLNGVNGFQINGISNSDYSGHSVSDAGDLNGDGYDDLIIGAHYADPSGNDRAGESYVIFGAAGGFDPSLDLSTLDGANGFALSGTAPLSESGYSVSGAGDINGDGYDDLIIGAWQGDPNGKTNAGAAYVVFGKAEGYAPKVALADLNGSTGFAINGLDGFDYLGISVSSAGDLNGDGLDDLVLGAYQADPNKTGAAGESYVIFGSNAGYPSSFDLSSLDGGNGFVINGEAYIDFSGNAVSGAGDINGDGYDDLIIGAYGADPAGAENAGKAYVVFGQKDGFDSSLDLARLDGSNGFALTGEAA